MAKGTFNPQEHLINLKGKNYLQVAHRVAWFKTEHGDDGGITTDVLQTEPFPLVKAFITINGVIVATGHGTAQTSNNAVYKGREIEKAETAAIGRALANAGYGTQFSEMLDDDSGDDLADSPMKRQQQQQQRPPATPQPTQQPTVYNAPPADTGDTKIYTCERITVLPRKDGFQYIAHCGHNVNIVTYTRELYRAAFGMLVDGWNVEVTAKGKSIPCTPPIKLKARVNGANLELVEVLAS